MDNRQQTLSEVEVNARPFLKWAGGKTQLLGELNKRLPNHIVETSVIERYVEPFVGGGAMFFNLKRNFNIKQSYLFDINIELIMCYKVIQKNNLELIEILHNMEEEYISYDSEKREKMYYEVRKNYNEQILSTSKRFSKKWIDRAAKMIFLNKTCYNGLYRQNSKGEFNVPFGKYTSPTICDENNIIEVNKALQNTELIHDDFLKSRKYIECNTLVYLDPPYRPINNTSSFTDYSKEGFSEKDQRRLATFFKDMVNRKACLILSNSDPKNINQNDNFFDELYKDAHIKIERVLAKRFINSDATKRGNINEIIVYNCK